MTSVGTMVLIGWSSMATKDVLAAVSAPGVLHGCPPVTFSSAGGVTVVRRILDGEPADVVVLAAGAIERLAAADAVDTATITPLFLSEGVVAVREGAAVPDVSTLDALRATVLAAPTIGYSTGPSGDSLLRRLEEWDLREVVTDRLVQAPAGVPVAQLIADGKVDLGFQQRSELVGRPGVHVVGGMPPGADLTTVFAGAVLASSSSPADAARVLAALASLEAVEVVRTHHLEPAP